MTKKHYIIFILAICLSFLSFAQPAEAGVVQFSGKDINVDFDGLPFNLNNWAPGMSDAKIITIENNENFDINVYFKAKEISSPDILGNALTITIDNQSKHLSDLFNNNLSLTSINAGKSQDYDIALSFDSTAGNKYQNKTINFDFLITVEQIGGNGGGGGQVVIPGGGGGGALPQGHIVFSEKEGIIATTSATISWQTSYFSTSQIIYGTTPNQFDFNAGPEKYGYEFVTAEDINKVSVHLMTLTGLIPGTTYYYRCVSHASPATISQNEHSFTTLAIVPIPTPTPGPTPPGPGPSPGPTPTPEPSPESGPVPEPSPGPGTDVIPDTTLPDTILPAESDSEMGDIGLGAYMMAAIGSIMDSKFLFGISLFLLFLLIVLLIKETRERYLKIKRKKIRTEKKKKEWHPFDQS
jgi:hypothetical protein